MLGWASPDPPMLLRLSLPMANDRYPLRCAHGSAPLKVGHRFRVDPSVLAKGGRCGVVGLAMAAIVGRSAVDILEGEAEAIGAPCFEAHMGERVERCALHTAESALVRLC
jgi:hypothetical protein